MFQITQEEIGEIIDITEEMCNLEGWTEEALPLAQKRMVIIEKARSRPAPSPETITKELALELCMDARKDAAAQAREEIRS